MMGEEIYRKKECEVCGKFAFEKHLKTSSVLDGGYTRIEEYEKSGFGHIVINYWDIKDVKDTRVELKLCPECAKQIDLALYKAIEKLRKKGGAESE